jgi:quercetin 2,3-dioxygenase
MITVRKAEDRGRFQIGWLDSRHSFSFGQYYDPQHMGVSLLRVINDDRITPGAGFGTHPHRDMEIVSYVLDGELEHRDSMGNGSVIRPHDVQRMSAGTGVTHSEFNPSQDNGTNFLQIWLLPKYKGIKPGYEQKHFAPEERSGKLQLLISPDGDDGSISANTDASMYGAILNDGESVSHDIARDKLLYVHVARGAISLNGETLGGGDGATVSDEESVTLVGQGSAEVLLFEMPATPTH